MTGPVVKYSRDPELDVYVMTVDTFVFGVTKKKIKPDVGFACELVTGEVLEARTMADLKILIKEAFSQCIIEDLKQENTIVSDIAAQIESSPPRDKTPHLVLHPKDKLYVPLTNFYEVIMND